MVINFLSTYNTEQEEKKDLIRLLAYLINEQGGEVKIKGKVMDEMVFNRGEVLIHRELHNGDVILRYREGKPT